MLVTMKNVVIGLCFISDLLDLAKFITRLMNFLSFARSYTVRLATAVVSQLDLC